MTRDDRPDDGPQDSTPPSLNDKPASINREELTKSSKLRKHWRLILCLSTLILLEVILAVLLAVFSKHLSVGKTVDLGYARYRGSLLPNSEVKAWLGMRYAASPVGDLRFAAPQDPITVKGVQDATRHGNTCLSVGDKPPVRKSTDEDCLFLDVYAPSEATSESRLPVFFFIQGGGFAGNANANYNGRGLIEAAHMDMVVVTFNYRVGPYGFMAGNSIDSPNNGLKDQRKALEWVQQHISKFGGNPDHVVLGGDSAGGASVALHMSAYGGKETNLFHAAALQSPSFATVLTNNQSQFLFDAFVNNTACDASSDALSCLRGLSSDDLQQANQRYRYPGAAGLPVFSWNPVIDGDFVQDLAYSLFNEGKFVNIPIMVGDDSNGGTIFAPRNINTLDQSNQFLKSTFPYLNQTHIDKLNQLYPNDPQDVFPGTGSYWRQAAKAYGELRYMCPNIFLATAVNTHKKAHNISAWNYRYNVQDSRQVANGLGVPHTVELAAIWGPDNVDGDPVPDSYHKGKSNAAIVPMMQGYWASFVRSFDPNKHRTENAPTWNTWSAELDLGSRKISSKDDSYERLLFDSPVKDTKMEVLDDGLWERCEYLWSISLDLRQ